MEDFEKAESLFRESMLINKEILGQNHPYYCMDVYNLSNTYLRTNEYNKAEEFAIEALITREKVLGEKHPDYIKSITQLATVYYLMNKYEKAEPLIVESMDKTITNIFKNFSFLSDEEKELYLQTVSNRFDFYNSFALNIIDKNPAFARDIFNYSLKNKALLLKSSTVMKNSIFSSKDSALINKYGELIDLRKQLSRLYGSTVNEQMNNIDSLENKVTEVEKN